MELHLSKQKDELSYLSFEPFEEEQRSQYDIHTESASQGPHGEWMISLQEIALPDIRAPVSARAILDTSSPYLQMSWSKMADHRA